MALIKSPRDLSNIRIAGKKLAGVLSAAREYVKPGLTTAELDAFIAEKISAIDAIPSFLGYEGFPASSCLSVNDQVVHGIPGPYVLKEGDSIGIDAGLWFEGVCVDSAITVEVGKVSSDVEKLLRLTKQALNEGIKAAKPFRRVGAISQAIQAVAEANNLGIVRSLTGHGVGHHVHEAPEVPNFGRASDGMLLKPGMVLAIEPMLTLGGADVLTEIDGWGVVTADRSVAAHFEHTVIITNRSVEIVTA